MKKQRNVMKRFTIVFMAVMLLSQLPAAGEQPKQQIKTLIPILAGEKPLIDGILDDAAWQGEALVNDIFITYNPVNGQVLPKQTKVWMAYDSDNLYFAFYCYDDEPDKIKTSVARRDAIFSDDFVGLALDALGNRQCLYEFFVNPSGSQGDLYNTPATGENHEPDWVWFSGGKIQADGYTVEVQIPLKSIRFNHGDNVEMNVLFWRRINRLNMSGAWPEIEAGKGLLNCLAKVSCGKLNKQLLLEFIPAVTYGSIWDRETPDNWTTADDKTDFGLSARYGITSAITAEITYNPDFSQVESDAFQVLRNQRYPIFYSEKRPFFMEASDLFELSGSHDNLYTAVHTRKIVEPQWGARLTGDAGKFSFGALAAADEWPGRALADEENFYLGERAYYSIGRLKYGFNGDSHIGLLYSGKELGDFYNRALALDTGLRFGKAHSLKANIIGTRTYDPETADSTSSYAGTARYTYATKTFYSSLDLEKYDADFRMDTAFYRRTGITSAQLFLVPTIIFKSKKLDGLKSIEPVLGARYLYDDTTNMADRYFNLGIMWNFTKANVSTGWDIIDDESWAGQTFKTGGFWAVASIYLTKWLRFNCSFDGSNRIYYDEEDPFLGDCRAFSLQIIFQPVNTLSFLLSYDYNDFDRKSSGEDVYDYHILYFRSIYQPNKHLFFRSLIQYDSYLDQIMSDVLVSYEFVPGTVFHIGYGSLHEQCSWDGAAQEWQTDVTGRRFYQTTQSFFVKLSYRVQF